MSEHLSPRAAERRFYLLTTTRWLPVGFVVGIFILVQTGRGLSIAQAATVGSVMGITCFLLELPTSGFADAVGRRPVYLTAAVINVVAITAYAVAQSFWAFVVAGALMGAFRALDSGPLEAWFVDTVHETTPGVDVDRPLSRAGSILGGGDRHRRGALRPAHLVEPRRHRARPRGRLGPRRRRLGVGGPVAWCTSSPRGSS